MSHHTPTQELPYHHLYCTWAIKHPHRSHHTTTHTVHEPTHTKHRSHHTTTYTVHEPSNTHTGVTIPFRNALSHTSILALESPYNLQLTPYMTYTISHQTLTMSQSTTHTWAIKHSQWATTHSYMSHHLTHTSTTITLILELKHFTHTWALGNRVQWFSTFFRFYHMAAFHEWDLLVLRP